MKSLNLKALLFLSTLLFSTLSFSSYQCHEVFISKNYLQAQLLAQQTQALTENGLKNLGIQKGPIKGYAVLVGTMVGSAALTTYLGSKLPSNLQFTSIFLSQITVLGVYVLGAPIWEPISSRFRKWAFGIKSEQQSSNSSNGSLEKTWAKTQENYSLNEQMSRNITHQFIYAVKQNFYYAHRAFQEKNLAYSADQVAEAAYRMRILFKDVEPNDPSVAAAINSAFTNHIKVTNSFRELVWEKIQDMDPQASSREAFVYYEVTLTSWLGLE